MTEKCTQSSLKDRGRTAESWLDCFVVSVYLYTCKSRSRQLFSSSERLKSNLDQNSDQKKNNKFKLMLVL